MTGGRTLLFISKPLGLRAAECIAEIAPETLAGIVTIDDRADTRSACDAILAFGERHGVPVRVAANRQDSEAIVRDVAPDLVVVIGWYWLISEETLRIPRRGFAGVHASLLPRYRGNAPLVWTIINGDSEGGVTLFQFTPGMDDGPLWDQRAFPIPLDMDIAGALAVVEDLTVDMLRKNYRGMLDGSITPRPQIGEPTFCKLRRPRDGAIDWTWPAKRVYDFVRAQTRPYPGAFMLINDAEVRIWRATMSRMAASDARPGTLVAAGDRRGVVCGDGSILVIEEAEFP